VFICKTLANMTQVSDVAPGSLVHFNKWKGKTMEKKQSVG
jgi:hypothetical protein